MVKAIVKAGDEATDKAEDIEAVGEDIVEEDLCYHL